LQHVSSGKLRYSFLGGIAAMGSWDAEKLSGTRRALAVLPGEVLGGKAATRRWGARRPGAVGGVGQALPTSLRSDSAGSSASLSRLRKR